MQLERHDQLSELGRARRDAMLGELVGVMQQHHRQRKLRRSVAAIGATVLLVACGLYYAASANSNMPAAPARIVQHEPVEETAPLPSPAVVVRIARVETQPGIAERYRAEASNIVVAIDDTELLETLQRYDRPTGLVRMGGEVFLTASVVDQPSAHNGRPNSL
jgi:hypothetical protein